jgi:hypothetical protein
MEEHAKYIYYIYCISVYGRLLHQQYDRLMPSHCVNYRGRRKIRLIESNAKCYLKKLTCKGTLRQVFICLRPPPLVGFCLGW